MCDGAPAGANDLEEGMSVRGVQLKLGGELSEEENLNGCPGTIPPCKGQVDEKNEYKVVNWTHKVRRFRICKLLR